MKDIRQLLEQMAAEEEAFRKTKFLAPCVRGGKARAKVAGLIQSFVPIPRDFEGWGVFAPVDERTACVVEEAGLPLVAEYLRLLIPLRVRLARPLKGQTWLAYSVNESDARQRVGAVRPLPVHLVTEGAAFETVVARGDGSAWWFEETDRRADPQIAERLREAQHKLTLPEALRFPGVTPEMRAAYDLAVQETEAFQALLQPGRDEARLEQALRMAGGTLRGYQDHGDYWVVDWTTRDGERHTSAIARKDLTVMSAGICLSGQDRNFDLQSLVGVVERQWEDEEA